MLNFLEEPLFTAGSIDNNKSRYSLPGSLAALVKGEILSFSSLRTHQRHVWHAFIVQLAALALEKAKENLLPDDEASWAKLLRALTPRWPNGEPWSLIVSDAEKPAILQAPVPGGVLPQFRTVDTPDGIDVLVTSKNHDLKSARMWKAAPEDWLFSLVSLQTQQGVMGAGKYGISRMNGGYGSRTLIGLDRSGDPGFRFRRDVMALISCGERAANPHGLNRSGIALLWLKPWDGVKTLDFKDLHPLYIEICRRIRLGLANGRVIAMDAPSKAARLSGTEYLNGNTGDPWTAVSPDGKSFTVSAEGFSGRKIADLFSPEKFSLPVSMQLSACEGEKGITFVAQSVCRGQGRTSGYHERRISIPPEAASLLIRDRHAFGEILQRRAEALSELRLALRFGLFVLCHRGPAPELFDKETTRRFVEPALEQFSISTDRSFGDGLWDEMAAQGEKRSGIYCEWLSSQVLHAQNLLSEAPKSLPYPSAQRYWAKAQSRLAFEEALKKSAHFQSVSKHSRPEEVSGIAHREGQEGPAKAGPPASLIEAIGDLLSAKWFPNIQSAELKSYQLDQSGPGEKIALRILAVAGLPIDTMPRSELLRWVWLVHCIALSGNGSQNSRSESNENQPGRVLFAAGCTELRVGRLLEAQGPPLQMLFERVIRSVIKLGQPINWAKLAPLILQRDPESGSAELIRREIACNFLVAAGRSRLKWEGGAPNTGEELLSRHACN
jgi:CRISPR system Cascade subunit CasA